MLELNSFLKEHHDFPRASHVEERTSIARIYGKRNRCGIYVLRFSNGDVYVGKSKDVTRRYVQHRQIHDDISHVSFKRVAWSRLDIEEKSIIQSLEKQQFTLRNITYTSNVKGESEFDLLMPLTEQEEWVNGHDAPLLTGTRIQEDILRQRYQKRFEELLTKPYAEEVIEFLRRYVQLGLPVPVESEKFFWSCSCLPTYKSRREIVYSRININWQEVLVVGKKSDVLCIYFQLALSPLELEHDKSLKSLKKKHKGLKLINFCYEAGGQDQIRLYIRGFDAACQLLADPTVQSAIRLFNLRLMKKGECIYSRYHCMDLANRLLVDKPFEFDASKITQPPSRLRQLKQLFSQMRIKR